MYDSVSLIAIKVTPSSPKPSSPPPPKENTALSFLFFSAMGRTWSIAHGMRHGRSGVSPRGMGNAEEKEGAACTAGKDWHPMLWLSVKPKIPRTWLWVTSLPFQHT